MNTFQILKKNLPFLSMLLILIATLTSCCTNKDEYYTYSDFYNVQKTDAHMHYRTTDPDFLLWADSLKFKLITPNTGTIKDKQFEVAKIMKSEFPDNFAFYGTFSNDNWSAPDFAETTIARIDKVMKAGAVGIKIWKNIGMNIRDSTGRYIMVDDPVFKPIFDYMEDNHIRLLAHLGEPRNCWLPLEEMTVKSNRTYYEKHPEYHMYLHPNAPSYEDQMNARDKLLIQHPKLEFIGAHLNSQEWSIDELGASFERFPQMTVDMAGRVNHFMHQSITRREEVRDFIIKYQDRMMYGTDKGVDRDTLGYEIIEKIMLNKWLDEWMFFVSDSTYEATQLSGKIITGLNLPKKVIDKIYYENAEKFFQ
jgi:Amidohydrolase